MISRASASPPCRAKMPDMIVSSMKRVILNAYRSLLDIPISPTSWEECDAEFQEVCSLLRNLDKDELLSRPPATDLDTIGPLFVELSSAAFWSNSLLFYQVALKIVGLHLRRGTVSQVALGYVYLGAIAAGRFNMIGTTLLV